MELTISILVGGVLKGCKTVVTPCLIGRSKEAGLTLPHPAMSRKHCELFEDGGKLFLRDNGSLNGTLFHGSYLDGPVSLAFGDEFTVGELTFRVTAPENVTNEERQAFAERPTAAIRLDDELELAPEADQPGMATVLDVPVKETVVPENIRIIIRK